MLITGLGVSLGLSPEGRGSQQSFIRGGSAPRSNPLPLLYTRAELLKQWLALTIG